MCLSSCFTSSTENYHQRKWGKSKPGKSDAMCTIVCCQSLELLTLNGQLNRSIAAAALIPPTTDEGSQLFHAEMLSVGTFLTTATWKWDLVGISAEKLTRWFWSEEGGRSPSRIKITIICSGMKSSNGTNALSLGAIMDPQLIAHIYFFVCRCGIALAKLVIACELCELK